MSAARRRASSRVGIASSLPGITGTPAFHIADRAAALSPICRKAETDGPMNLMPHDSHSSAKSAFSARGP
ncbi:MAG: hypothetical protein HW381_1852 [Candidatus Rokubacteria bacterium]|nr:hypothetical protein [Candidatus Rokubacteria bacterium]